MRKPSKLITRNVVLPPSLSEIAFESLLLAGRRSGMVLRDRGHRRCSRTRLFVTQRAN